MVVCLTVQNKGNKNLQEETNNYYTLISKIFFPYSLNFEEVYIHLSQPSSVYFWPCLQINKNKVYSITTACHVVLFAGFFSRQRSC